MEHFKHERLISANEDLRDLVRRAESAVKGTRTISEGDLQTLSQCISNRAPSIGDASRSETLDTDLRSEIADYVRNFRALQTALDKIRCVIQTRRL